MVPESRVVADLLLSGVDAAGWRQAIQIKNVFAKRSVSTAATKATLIRGRLTTLPPASFGVARDGSKPAATHAESEAPKSSLELSYSHVPNRPQPDDDRHDFGQSTYRTGTESAPWQVDIRCCPQLLRIIFRKE